MVGPVLEAYFKFFLKQNIVRSFQFFHIFLLASLTRKQKFTIFNTILFWFLNQSRHLQIEVGVGGADDFDTWSHLEQKKTKKIVVQYARGSVPN